MNSTGLSSMILRGLLGGGALCTAFSLSATAQVETQKTETHGQATKTVKVERGEIVYVSGNSVVVRMEDGTLRHFDNIPESTTITVDGKQLNINSSNRDEAGKANRYHNHTEWLRPSRRSQAQCGMFLLPAPSS